MTAEDELKCQNCGAPVSLGPETTSDFRTCPFCHRKLLALASPACSYCGRRLPESYIKAREADFRRVAELNEGDRQTEDEGLVNEILGRNSRGKRGGLSLFGLGDIAGFFD
jgi:DNA-directed RNA polymerase subunit RPC12/RpoP